MTILKIDRSYITGTADDERARRIAEAIVGLGSAFGMQVVAEGIETADQARLLTDMGCGIGQGYHFHRPPPPETLAEILRHTMTPTSHH